MAYPEGITKEMVDASAEEFMSKLGPLHGTLNDLLVEKPRAIAASNLPVEEKYARLFNLADHVLELLGPSLPCSKGCDACCNMSVVITVEEAQTIADYLHIEISQPPPLSLQQDYVDKYSGCTCPFLKNHECTVYEVRPLPCRTHMNISKYTEICNVIKYPGCDTPAVDMRGLWLAAALAGGIDAVYGDIREFFPYGAEPPVFL